MNYQIKQLLGKWQGRIGVVPTIYRLSTFGVAAALILFFRGPYYSVIPPVAVVIAVGIYTVVKALYPFGWYTGDILSRTVLGSDSVICICLVMATGGLYSPFIFYSLAPVLTAALLADRKSTVIVAGLAIASVIVSHQANPLPPPLPSAGLRALSLYGTAACLTAFFPFLINANLRRRLQLEHMLQEGQRLSREIHDGAAQTLSSIRWQAQLLRRRLAEMGVDLDEARQLETLAEKGYEDARESMERLRTYTGNGSFLPHLKDYLQHLSQDSDIDFRLDVEADKLQLTAPVQLELLRICQEALTNVRKHSQAHRVEVKVKPAGDGLEVSIVDDGCGFDAIAYYRNGAGAERHGLAVMRERAQSLGGNLVVLSQPGSGTEVKLSVPVRKRRWHR